MKRAGSSRGQAVAKLTEDVLRGRSESAASASRSASAKALALQRLDRYQHTSPPATAATCRSKPAATTPRIKPDWAELSGYDRIALMTMRAIVHNQGAIIPLDVANRGTLPFLDDEDIVEVPCRVDKDGPVPQAVAPIPDHPRELIERVKTYERATVKAALTGDRDAARRRPRAQSAGQSREQAARLVEALL